MRQAIPKLNPIRVSLKWQVIAFMCLLILVVASTLSWYFLHQSRSVLTVQFEATARMLAETLAHNSESDLFSHLLSPKPSEELAENLGGFVLSVFSEPSALHVIITDKEGVVVAEKTREGAAEKLRSETGRLALQLAASLATNVLVATNTYHLIGDEQILHTVAPVLFKEDRLGGVQIIFALAATRAAIHKALFTGAGLALIIIIAGSGLAFLFGQRALTPIQEMAVATSKIAGGDLSQRVKVDRRDEIGLLAGSFNHMAESLAEMTHGLEEKVEQRTEELRRVNLELQRATQHKSEFVANMSHELRTPLNAVIGFSEVLLERMFGPLNAKQEEYITDVLTSGRHLLSLINDILDLSKIEAGKMELERSIFDLRQVIENSLVIVKERALLHGIQLSVEIGDGVGLIEADERRVKQILFNLLSNSVKFTPDKGRVGIRARGLEGAVEVAVWDTGVGIAAEDRPKLFAEFQQLESGLTNKPEGTGLGLNLTKRFIELHGGHISVESAPGKGSIFTFDLPVTPAIGQLTLPVIPATVAMKSPVAGSAPRPRILVIEDDPKAADILRIYLNEAGYGVMLAADGAEGLQKIRQERPAAIILDVLLPKVDGWAFLKQLKADADTKNLPVIMASVVDQKSRGFALGAADYLVKPVRKEELLEKLGGLHLSGATGPKKILAIDDDPKTVELLGAMLEAEGFQVLKAYDGEAGLELAQSEQPDLIILDLLMPGTNGFDVLDRLQSSSQTSHLPVVLFTIKQLTAEEKQRIRGRVNAVAPKQASTKENLVGIVNQVLHQNATEGIQP